MISILYYNFGINYCIASSTESNIYTTEIGKESGDIYFVCYFTQNGQRNTNIFRRAYNETQVRDQK